MSRLFPAALFGLAFAAGVAAGPARAQDGKSPPPAKGDHKHHFMECAKACDDCARVCEECSAHCAKMVADGKREHLETLKTCRDCATVCHAAGAVTARTGPFADVICAACADACKRCGDACERHAADPMMRRCLEECRRCEKACRDMVPHARTPAAQ